MKALTLSQIRAANLAAGFHTFDRATMRFFGETMKNWSAPAGGIQSDGRQRVFRHGGRAGSATFLFNPKNGSLRKQT